jgi:hypothetical protein
MVGGFNPSEKYESPLGFLFPTEWKKMFQTTNQPKVKLFPPSDPFLVVNWDHFAQPQRSKKVWPYHLTMGRTKKITCGSHKAID